MPSVAELLIRIDATTEGLRRELAVADQRLGTFSKNTDKSLAQIDGGFTKLGSKIGGITSAFGALGVAIGGLTVAKSFVDMADAATTMENRLKTVTSSAEELKYAQDLLYQSSQENGVETSASVELFARLSRALKGTGADAERVAEMVDTLSKVVRLSGATSAEASGALLQFSQAMNKGVLNGEEFNSMAENLPMLLEAIASHLANLNGISLEQAKAELKDMAAEGEITTEIITGALEGMSDGVNKAFSEIEDTSATAVTKMWNSLTRLIGKINDVTGVSETLVERVGGVTAAFDFGVSALEKYGGALATLIGWINAVPHPLSLLAQAAAGASAQVAQAANEITAVMKSAAAARAELGSGVPAWKAGPGEGPEWGGNITRMGKAGTARLAGQLGGAGLAAIEAKRGAKVLPVETNPMNVAAITGGKVDFTTLGVEQTVSAAERLGVEPIGAAAPAVTGVTRELPKLKFYQAPPKEEKKAAEALQKRAEKLKESIRTPQEEFQSEVSEYETLLAQKLINPEDYNRAFREAGAKMQKALMQPAGRSAKPARKVSDELTRRAERVRSEIQTADEEYEAELDNLGELMKKGRLTEEEYKRGVEHAKTELAAAKKPKGGGGGGGRKTGEDKEQARAEREGLGISKDVMTETEAYSAEIARLDDLLARNAITFDEHQRAVKEAGAAMQQSQMAFDGGREAAQAYLNEIAALDGQLAAGSLSQDEYNIRVLEAQQKYSDAQSSSASYAYEIARLDQALAAGAISQEEYAASVDVARTSMNQAAMEGAALIDAMRTPLERFNDEMRRLEELWSSGAIGDETKMRKATELLNEYHQELLATNDHLQRMKDMSDDLGMAMAGAFEDAIIEGGKLGDILKSLWEDIQRIVIRQLVTIPLASGISAIIGGAVMGGMMPMGAGAAEGGLVKGKGSGTSDSIPAMLSSGEYVVNARATQKHLQLLEAINDNRGMMRPAVPKLAMGGLIGANVPRFAAGGFVGAAAAAGSGPIEIKLENKSDTPLKLEGAQQRKGANGGAMISVLITDAVKAALNAGEFDKSMGNRYGAAVQPIGR